MGLKWGLILHEIIVQNILSRGLIATSEIPIYKLEYNLSICDSRIKYQCLVKVSQHALIPFLGT